MVARVGKHDATRPVAELQSASDRRIDRRTAHRRWNARFAGPQADPRPAAGAGL